MRLALVARAPMAEPLTRGDQRDLGLDRAGLVEGERSANQAMSRRAILKPRGVGGAGAALHRTVFRDDAPVAHDLAAAVAEGAAHPARLARPFRPADPLRRLARGAGTSAGFGGSRGAWVLEADALGQFAPALEGWELILCPAAGRDGADADAADAADAEAEEPVEVAVAERIDLPTVVTDEESDALAEEYVEAFAGSTGGAVPGFAVIPPNALAKGWGSAYGEIGQGLAGFWPTYLDLWATFTGYDLAQQTERRVRGWLSSKKKGGK